MLTVSFFSFAQSIMPPLSLRNPVLVSGSDKAAPVVNPLPVILGSFTAESGNANKAGLSWSTTAEVNASHFRVQRSLDAVNFDDVAIVFTQEGNSASIRTYNYPDNISSVNATVIYYRLKMVDMEGSFSYSGVEAIRVDKQENDQAIAYLSQATNELRITIPDSWQNKVVIYSIYNMHGSLVKAKIDSHAGQTETLPLSGLSTGTYLIKTASGKNVTTQRFVKIV